MKVKIQRQQSSKLINFWLQQSSTPTTTDSASYHRDVTQAIFIKFNQNIFAVIFWFAILGPLGAVLYRAIDLINVSAHKDGSPNAPLPMPANCSENYSIGCLFDCWVYGTL